ncbi:hypothetical protein [endosymbiont GvMRE of Glomus versiforme]|nr:hypothetical protein [endosymbiont GvMRE of Glomus versiforme]
MESIFQSLDKNNPSRLEIEARREQARLEFRERLKNINVPNQQEYNI